MPFICEDVVCILLSQPLKLLATLQKCMPGNAFWIFNMWFISNLNTSKYNLQCKKIRIRFAGKSYGGMKTKDDIHTLSLSSRSFLCARIRMCTRFPFPLSLSFSIPRTRTLFFEVWDESKILQSSVGQRKGLWIPRLSVQFRQKTRTQIYIDFSYVDSPSLARVLNYCFN